MDCKGGYAGRLLEVDLTAGRIEKAPLDESLTREFLGGAGLAARLFLERFTLGADPLSPAATLSQLMPQAPLHGSFWRPDLSWDGTTVLFCFKPHNEKSFHLYEIKTDGSGLTQLTEGPFDDFDPIYLPDGQHLRLAAAPVPLFQESRDLVDVLSPEIAGLPEFHLLVVDEQVDRPGRPAGELDSIVPGELQFRPEVPAARPHPPVARQG